MKRRPSHSDIEKKTSAPGFPFSLHKAILNNTNTHQFPALIKLVVGAVQLRFFTSRSSLAFHAKNQSSGTLNARAVLCSAWRNTMNRKDATSMIINGAGVAKEMRP
ncbi:hypothetical protein ACFL2V_01770 [Pseudomonadota bacterium]